MPPEKVSIVIPCYNEAKRFRSGHTARFLEKYGHITLILVNDGSTDGTAVILEALARQFPDRCRVMHLAENRGKAEAVRRGLLQAFAAPVKYAGYWDADFSTPLPVIHDFARILDIRPDLYMVIGSRVLLLGRTIERSPFRHYLGRVFATAASQLLKLKVYDTQCGAKLFRVCPEIRQIFATGFQTRWVFDVEIIARWKKIHTRCGLPPAAEAIYEYSLKEWRHSKGSKIGWRDGFSVLKDLIAIYRQY